MSKTKDTERTRELEADRDELLDSGLDTVTGGFFAFNNIVAQVNQATQNCN